ncbi:MAG: hypothetical protein LBL15_00590 [Oscillospiraceae bacterium]|nr:hypothetical protein [Oscillospiraceae bacterium]
MKTRFKIVLVGVLFMLAIAASAFVIVNFVSAEDGGAAECIAAETADVCYVLRNHGGYVAIFVENNGALPMTVTDIQVATLRELDRKLLETGMKLYSRERLMMTLEDLGS